MTVKEVLTMATQFLNIETELKSIIAADTPNFDNSQFAVLYNACMIAYEELATDYFPLLKREEVVVNNNRLNYEDLSEELKDIYKVEDISGKNIRFRCYPDYCDIAANGTINITYSYVPVIPDFNGSFDSFCGRVTRRSFSLLVASEYAFISGYFDDAKIWHKRFRDSIRTNLSKKATIIMPKRKWL